MRCRLRSASARNFSSAATGPSYCEVEYLRRLTRRGTTTEQRDAKATARAFYEARSTAAPHGANRKCDRAGFKVSQRLRRGLGGCAVAGYGTGKGGPRLRRHPKEEGDATKH